MSHGSFTETVNASGHVRWIASCSDSTPASEVLHRPRPRGLRVRDHLLAAGAVEPRVVQDAVVAGERPVRIDVWFASVTVGQPGHRAPLVRRAHLDQAGDVRRLARGGHVVEHVGVGAVEQEADDVPGPPGRRDRARRCARRRPARRGGGRGASGSHPRSSAIVGATSTSRAARGTRPSLRTPLPAITNGARACTTPSEPCSPRWPPWSSQLCAPECSTHRSGAAGWSKSCAIWSYANGYELRVACGVRVGELGGRGRRAGRATGRRTGRSPCRRSARSRRRRRRRRRPAGTRPGRRRSPPRTSSPVRLDHHVDDRCELAVQQHVERGSRLDTASG